MRGIRNRWRGRRSAAGGATPVEATLFARANPECIAIEERFGYEQQISRNPHRASKGCATGKLAISVPYDGHEHFTRDAVQDVDRYLRRQTAQHGALDALVGHLVFADHQDTDLSDVLALDRRLDSFPLRIPVPAGPRDTMDVLAADRFEYRMEQDYVPSEKRLELLPISLDVELADPDHNDLLATDVLKHLRRDESQRVRVADNIKRFIGFKPLLQVRVIVRVVLPSTADPPEQHPVIRQVSVEMPISASLAESSLAFVDIPDASVQHNPETWHLEWCNVKMQPEKPINHDQPRTFSSPAMKLLFKQPGELFARRTITVTAEVEVPDELLSGTKVRAFDALGQRRPKGRDPLTMRTMLQTTCTVVLSDAFARRMVSPYQSFHFDEVIPDPLRIADIHIALSDQRFTILFERDLETPKGKRQLRHLLLAQRANGPDTMTLLVLVEGRRHPTQRQARQPGGHRYTSKFDSGDLRMFVRGEVRRDTSNLVHEINDLQLTLRERFRHLKAHR